MFDSKVLNHANQGEVMIINGNCIMKIIWSEVYGENFWPVAICMMHHRLASFGKDSNRSLCCSILVMRANS
jgi:hypothetical protein